VFDGSAQQLVAHLVESGQLSDQERKELRRLMTNEKE
jgi:predicted transcriptional regulator